MSTSILVGDARERLRELPAGSVHCVVTSPPYWGLRSYEGESGMIGLEKTFDEHLVNLVAVFREVRRVLRDDGSVWLNYGSAYAGGGRGGGAEGSKQRTNAGSLIAPLRAASPNQPRQHQNDPACGSDGRGLLNCREPDCVCSGLCGECQAAIRSHHGRTDGTLLPDAQSLRPSGTTDRDTERQGYSPPAPSPPAHLESSTPQSSQPPPVACSPERSQAASVDQSAPGSSRHDVPATSCRGCGFDIPGTFRQWPVSCSRTGNGLFSSAYGNYAIAPHKAKDLINMPAFVAEALRADGWYLRSKIIWNKPNPMPESCTDRPTSAYEEMFLMTKAPHYFYDADAVRVTLKEDTIQRYERGRSDDQKWADGGPGDQTLARSLTHMADKHRGQYAKPYEGKTGKDFSDSGAQDARGVKARIVDAVRSGRVTGANLRNVWTIPTSSYKSAHFATFPPALVEPCIRAGTSERGVCGECGAPWKRQVDVSHENPGNRTTNGPRSEAQRHETAGFSQRLEKRSTTTGWAPTCEHYDDRYRERDLARQPKCARKRRQRAAWPGRWRRVRARAGGKAWDTVPAVVLDPFGGSGTVGLVAERLQRDAILIELSSKYADMARKRIVDDAPLLNTVEMHDEDNTEVPRLPASLVGKHGSRLRCRTCATKYAKTQRREWGRDQPSGQKDSSREVPRLWAEDDDEGQPERQRDAVPEVPDDASARVQHGVPAGDARGCAREIER